MNVDGVIDVGDVVYLINYLFKNGTAPFMLILGDVNRDSNVDVSDVVFLINYLFKNGPPPVDYPEVGKTAGLKGPLSRPAPVNELIK